MIIELSTLLSFLGASILLTLMPGPDNLFVLSLGVSKGARAALPLALGLAFGCFFHTAAVALGISALITASPYALLALKWLGASYLIYIAYRIATEPTPTSVPATLIQPPFESDVASKKAEHVGQSRYVTNPAANSKPKAATTLNYFARGLGMNILNPKVILFFIAFLPQFVDASDPNAAYQTLILGTVFVIQTIVIFGTIAVMAGKINLYLAEYPSAHRWMKILTVTLIVLLAINLLANSSFA